MNIFNKVTLQNMKKNRTRTLVTVIGVILSAAMITAVVTFAASLQNYMVNGAIEKYGGWHVEFPNGDYSFVQKQISHSGVTNVTTFQNIGYATLDNGKNPHKPYLFMAGFNKDTFGSLPVTLISGRLPNNSSEILIPSHVAANGGVKFSVGDTLSLTVGTRTSKNQTLSQHDPYSLGQEILSSGVERTYTVVGICERPSFEEYSAPGYTLITISDSLTQVDSFSTFVTLTNPREVHAYAGNTANDGAYVLNDNVLRFLGFSDDKLFNTLLYSVGGVLVALIMTGSVFLIYNAFNISLNERMRQFGILSSVGATKKQLRNSVLFEGLCIGAMGVPIGIFVGLSGIDLVLTFVTKNFVDILYDTVPLTLVISFPAMIGTLMFSMITILISAYIPARKAANTPVMESIRQTNQVKLEINAVKTSKFAERIYGLEGTLALKNFKRNKKRYGSIVLSLTLSVVLFVSANAFGMCLKQAAEQSVVTVDYDLCFSSQDMEESDIFLLYDQLKSVQGVYGSSYQAILTYLCAVNIKDFSDHYREFTGYTSLEETATLPLTLQFIEDTEYMDFIESLGLPAEEYTGENAKLTAVAKLKQGDESAKKSQLVNMFANNSAAFQITSQTSDSKPAMAQTVDITFVDTIPLDTLPRQSTSPKSTVFMVIAPYSLKDRFEVSGAHEELGLTFLSEKPTPSAREMERIIQNAGITAEYNLYNVYEIMEQNRNIIFIVDVFTYVFVMMISLIAIANVFNTISTNIRLRRRELAMLRSVGMSDHSFKRMMNFECAFYGMRTLMFGLPLAAVLSWMIYRGVVMGGAAIEFIFPWKSMVISIFSVFFVVFITMLYAIGKLKKENIIDALRDEMA